MLQKLALHPVGLFSLVFMAASSLSTPALAATSVAADDELATAQFQLLPPSQTGIDFVHPIDVTHPRKYLYIGGFASAGIAIGDLDGDDVPDIFVSGGPVSNRLYLQRPGQRSRGSLKFSDVTQQAGVGGGNTWAAGVTLVDIDNDGDLDIYICNYDSPNQLYVNESHPGQVRFVESARQFGLDIVDACLFSAFSDYDRDGDLDVLVVGYQYVDPDGRPRLPPVTERNGVYTVKPEARKYYGIVRGQNGQQTFTNVGRRDYLLESNLADQASAPRFTDVTDKAGIDGLGVGNSAVWWDYDQDGWPDLYIANDFKVADQLYRNNRDGTFTDVIRQTVSHTTWFSMGSEAADVNNDGRIDLFVSDMAGTTHYRSKVTMGEMSTNRRFLATAEPRQYMRNALFINTGTPRFLEAAYMAGLAKSDWTWATKLADFDNDSLVDVYITNGAARMFNHSDLRFTTQEKLGKTQWEMWEKTPPRLEENLAFRNRGHLRFQDVSSLWGLKKKSMSYAAAYGDLDQDGALDLVVCSLNEPLNIYHNQTRNASRHVRVKLVGSRSNRFGIGALVRLKTQKGQQVRQMNPMQGFMSCNEPLVHFGISDSDEPVKITVEWPSGEHRVYDDVAVGQEVTLHESEGSELQRSEPSETPRRFVQSRTFPALRHIERDFDDFQRQPLLPFKHSQLGPGLALGDVDGDGDEDVYLSRAKGSRRAVYTNVGRGRLTVESLAPFQSETQFEDLGALFFDADRDGDRDLYVVSGSVECEPDDPSLRDRLYLNDGTGRFRKAPATALPDATHSGSVVTAADFDRDGDLDLFVGGRVVPGRYPESATSQLLQNNAQQGKAQLNDVTAAVAPGLVHPGLVTSAVWSDVDNDGWVDLMVTCEWGAVRYYRNEAQAGRRVLVDRTKQANLSRWQGWWNGIAARDLDNDGDVDYVVTNFGLNTTYHASHEKPELLYYGKFDGSDQPRIVEAKFEQDKCFPRRGLSCSSQAMPFIREKLKTYHDFGLSTLQEIYTKERLAESLRLEADTLETGVMINMGNASDGIPRFQFQALPPLAQISPSFGVAVSDFNADGWADIVLAQNFFSPQLETGRMDSGLSLLLHGQSNSENAKIQFAEVWPNQSGISIPGDAQAVCVVDFSEDGWDDLLFTVNDGVVQAYEGRPVANHQPFRVQLVGAPGNLDCVGSRVQLRFARYSSLNQTAEIQSGGGYLAQSSRTITFGCPDPAQPTSIWVRWPNGQQSRHQVEKGQYRMSIQQPKFAELSGR